MLDLSKPMEVEISIGDETLIVFCRRPSAKELTAFRATQMKRSGKKLVPNIVEARITGALRVMTGFKKGVIAVEGKLISSDPNDPDYHADWRKIFVKELATVVERIGQKAFELEGDEVEFETPDFDDDLDALCDVSDDPEEEDGAGSDPLATGP